MPGMLITGTIIAPSLHTGPAGAAQVVAVFGLCLGADVTEHLQYRLYRARLWQRGRRNKKKSFLYRREHRVYKSLSVDNLRRKTCGFIPDERAVSGQTEAMVCVGVRAFTALCTSLLLPLTTLGEFLNAIF